MPVSSLPRPSRRLALRLMAALPVGLALPTQAAENLTFDELYAKVSALGLEFSEKTKSLSGKAVTVRGFMAPPLKAEAKFFVLTQVPMALCPFCSSDADWPYNILVIYLAQKQTFTDPGIPIAATGRLERGSWTDPETGFVSQLRLIEAEYRTV